MTARWTIVCVKRLSYWKNKQERYSKSKRQVVKNLISGRSASNTVQISFSESVAGAAMELTTWKNFNCSIRSTHQEQHQAVKVSSNRGNNIDHHWKELRKKQQQHRSTYYDLHQNLQTPKRCDKYINSSTQGVKRTYENDKISRVQTREKLTRHLCVSGLSASNRSSCFTAWVYEKSSI